MDLNKLREPLDVHQIDFRIQSINPKGKATILAYKDARVDMQRLDEVVGPLGWKREHNSQNHNCVVSIWCEKTKQWVSKEDTGTESFTEAQKGLASDSFKRACFNWGIGRELYDYPRIVIELKIGDKFSECWLNDKKLDRFGNKTATQGYGLKLKEWSWFSEFNDKNQLTMLLAKDEKGTLRYEWRDIKQVKKLADAILVMLAEEDWSALAEAYAELEEWEQNLLNTAQSKGGFFNTEQKKTIKEQLYRFHNPEEEAA